MKERGMIFKGEMVCALLSGQKTQTRRPITPQPMLTERSGFSWKGCLYGAGSDDRETNRNFAHVKCPHGKPGDRIWVRETWAEAGAGAPDLKLYRANYPAHVPSGYENVPPAEEVRWTPSIHMPRSACRILLEITAVRVERLQAITLGDICKEVGCGLYDFRPATHGFQVWEELWESIYGAGSWQANPWVWVIDFKVVRNVPANSTGSDLL
ncbi:hypothetical protein [Citrobacter sp.]|uniref:hypothetical protein n=1 Tax=Citrobacter sp. TaxID=1896336 RepID=UPI003FA5348A